MLMNVLEYFLFWNVMMVPSGIRAEVKVLILNPQKAIVFIF